MRVGGWWGGSGGSDGRGLRGGRGREGMGQVQRLSRQRGGLRRWRRGG